jgi:hypothetical protein
VKDFEWVVCRLELRWNSGGAFEVTESVGLSCILFAIMARTIKAQQNLVGGMQAHKIIIKSLPDLEGPQPHTFFRPFC